MNALSSNPISSNPVSSGENGRDAARVGSQTGAPAPAGTSEPPCAFVTLMLAGQLCGIPVLSVRDVLAHQKIARIPLAPREVAGNLNLRGRIVTAIDLRLRLRLPPRPPEARSMYVVTEQGCELYALLVDQVSEVVSLSGASMEPNPPTLSAIWIEHSLGVYRLDEKLLVVLDVDRLLQIDITATP